MLIARDCQLANAPYLRKVRLVDASWVQGIDTPVGDSLTIPDGCFLFKPGADFIDIEFANKGASYTETLEPSPSGPTYIAELLVEVPRDSPSEGLSVSKLANRKFVALMRDANGVCKVAGTVKQPLLFAYTVSAADKNAWNFVFSSTQKQQAPYINGIDDTELYRYFSNEFSFLFS